MFKHTNSVLRDNDAQMGLKTVNIYGKNGFAEMYIYIYIVLRLWECICLAVQKRMTSTCLSSLKVLPPTIGLKVDFPK